MRIMRRSGPSRTRAESVGERRDRAIRQGADQRPDDEATVTPSRLTGSMRAPSPCSSCDEILSLRWCRARRLRRASFENVNILWQRHAQPHCNTT